MSVDQIRTTLEELESNYSMAMDFSAYSLANVIACQIDSLREELIRQICAKDPYTTEADVRYFEGF